MQCTGQTAQDFQRHGLEVEVKDDFEDRQVLQVLGADRCDGNYTLKDEEINGQPAWENADSFLVLYSMKNGRWGITDHTKVHEGSKHYILSERAHMKGGASPTQCRWGKIRNGKFEHLVDAVVRLLALDTQADGPNQEAQELDELLTSARQRASDVLASPKSSKKSSDYANDIIATVLASPDDFSAKAPMRAPQTAGETKKAHTTDPMHNYDAQLAQARSDLAEASAAPMRGSSRGPSVGEPLVSQIAGDAKTAHIEYYSAQLTQVRSELAEAKAFASICWRAAEERLQIVRQYELREAQRNVVASSASQPAGEDFEFGQTVPREQSALGLNVSPDVSALDFQEASCEKQAEGTPTEENGHTVPKKQSASGFNVSPIVSAGEQEVSSKTQVEGPPREQTDDQVLSQDESPASSNVEPNQPVEIADGSVAEPLTAGAMTSYSLVGSQLAVSTTTTSFVSLEDCSKLISKEQNEDTNSSQVVKEQSVDTNSSQRKCSAATRARSKIASEAMTTVLRCALLSPAYQVLKDWSSCEKKRLAVRDLQAALDQTWDLRHGRVESNNSNSKDIDSRSAVEPVEPDATVLIGSSENARSAPPEVDFESVGAAAMNATEQGKLDEISAVQAGSEASVATCLLNSVGRRRSGEWDPSEVASDGAIFTTYPSRDIEKRLETSATQTDRLETAATQTDGDGKEKAPLDVDATLLEKLEKSVETALNRQESEVLQEVQTTRTAMDAALHSQSTLLQTCNQSMQSLQVTTGRLEGVFADLITAMQQPPQVAPAENATDAQPSVDATLSLVASPRSRARPSSASAAIGRRSGGGGDSAGGSPRVVELLTQAMQNEVPPAVTAANNVPEFGVSGIHNVPEISITAPEQRPRTDSSATSCSLSNVNHQPSPTPDVPSEIAIVENQTQDTAAEVIDLMHGCAAAPAQQKTKETIVDDGDLKSVSQARPWGLFPQSPTVRKQLPPSAVAQGFVGWWISGAMDASHVSEGTYASACEPPEASPQEKRSELAVKLPVKLPRPRSACALRSSGAERRMQRNADSRSMRKIGDSSRDTPGEGQLRHQNVTPQRQKLPFAHIEIHRAEQFLLTTKATMDVYPTLANPPRNERPKSAPNVLAVSRRPVESSRAKHMTYPLRPASRFSDQ